MAMAVNTKLLEDRNLPMPKDWTDLIKPVYKGYITIAAPTKSGTGLSIFSTMHDVFGWNFIDNLHENIFQYNSSGSAAARQRDRWAVARPPSVSATTPPSCIRSGPSPGWRW